jgi:hypothetical protein
MTPEAEAESHVPHAPPTLEQVRDEVRRLSLKMDKVLRALSKDALDPNAPPGVIQVQEDHEERITALEDRHQQRMTWKNALGLTLAGGIITKVLDWLATAAQPHIK